MTKIKRIAQCCAVVGAAVASTLPARAQDPPDEDGNIGVIQQEIVAGTLLSVEEQRGLGLVTVAGGCSGTLLNRFWVLTARHCLSNEPAGASAAVDIGSPLWPAGTLAVSAAWDPGRAPLITGYREVDVNTGPIMPARDIVLAYLGRGDFGEVGRRIPYITQRRPTAVALWVGQRVTAEDRIVLYGQGYGTLASGIFGTPGASPAQGLGTYRSAVLTASNISDTGFDMVANPGQVGHGGDSGGPAVVYDDGRYAGIAGVQSTCSGASYIPSNSPANPTPQSWLWANGIAACQYVATEPFVREIGRAMRESPLCRSADDCAAWAEPTLSYLLRPDEGCGSDTDCDARTAPARIYYSLD